MDDRAREKIMPRNQEPASHRADDIVAPDGADKSTPGAMTRLEFAELTRRNAMRREMARHQQAMDEITAAFAREMRVA
jgi:hypothetical protein